MSSKERGCIRTTENIFYFPFLFTSFKVDWWLGVVLLLSQISPCCWQTRVGNSVTWYIEGKKVTGNHGGSQVLWSIYHLASFLTSPCNLFFPIFPRVFSRPVSTRFTPATHGGAPRKIGLKCEARFPKPLPSSWPKSAIFPTLFMTWQKKLDSLFTTVAAGTVALNVVYEGLSLHVDGLVDKDWKEALSKKHAQVKSRVQNPYTIYDQKIDAFFMTKTAENHAIPSGAAHTYIAHVRECYSRSRPQYAGGIWKRRFISTVRPTVHTSPWQKRSFA